MDHHRATVLRRALAGTPLLERVVGFGTGLRRTARSPGGLLLVGTPQDDPWHLAAHLADDARRAGVPELAPTLVRHHVPGGAPPHLAVGLERLSDGDRSDTLLVVADDDPGEVVLERLADARRRGATLFALHRGDDDVRSLAHEDLAVPAGALGGRRRVPELLDPARSLEVVQHIVSAAATDIGAPTSGGRWSALRAVLGGR